LQYSLIVFRYKSILASFESHYDIGGKMVGQQRVEVASDDKTEEFLEALGGLS
jgi:hypothetical protein